MLRFIIATKQNFDSANIPIIAEVSTNDGRIIKHIELLTDEQFDTVRFDSNFEFKSDLTGLIDTEQ